MKRFIYILAIVHSILIVHGQDVGKTWLKGKVYAAETNLRLNNVNVRVKNSQNVASTDFKGDFSLLVTSTRDSILFSCIGYADKILIVQDMLDRPHIYLSRKDNYLQEAVVNTGYQSVKTNEMTGAVDVLTTDMIQQQTGTNIMQRLNNMVPSVRWDNAPIQNGDLQKLPISVRGLSTINGNLDPLVVLDGFIYEGNIANIDPNSIASVSVLKDAAAAAIWGARAGNGVLVITSKKGSFSGEQISKISFNSTLIFSEKTDLNKLYQLSNKDYFDMEKYIYDKGYYKNYSVLMPYQALTPVIDIFERRRNGEISVADSAQFINDILNQNGRKNYSSAFYNVPLTQQYGLNVLGGSALQKYSLSVGYTDTRTELDAKSKKINMQLSNSFQLMQRLQLDLSILYTNQKDSEGRPSYTALTHGGTAVPYMQFLDRDANEIPFERDFRQNYLTQNFSKGYLDWSYFPLSEYRHANMNGKLSEWYGTVNMRYKLFSFANLNLGAQVQNQRVDNVGLNTLDSYETRSYINQFLDYNSIDDAVSYNVPLGGIRKSGTEVGSSYTFRGQLDVNKKWQRHLINGVLGAEARENKLSGESMTAYGFTERPLSSVPVDYTAVFFTKPNFGIRPIAGAPDFRKLNNRFVSMYANFNYVLDEKYAVSGSFRKDGANIFGVSTNDKWSPLWSVGSFWEIGKEDFIKKEWLDMLKFRTTYGYSGNVDLRKTPDPIAYIGSANYTNLPMLQINNLNDPSLRWEKIRTINLALDYAILKNRVFGSFDYYFKKGKDLYGMSDYDYSTWGFQGSITKNVASMEGQGWDLNLNSKNIQGRFNWTTRLVLSRNTSKTSDYYNALNNSVSQFQGNGYTIQPVVGRPLYGLSAFKWMGLSEKGEPQGLLNGEVSTDYAAIIKDINQKGDDSDAIYFVGASKPQVFGNLIHSFGWRNIGVSFNISYRGDYYFRKPVTTYHSLFRFGSAYPDYEHRWKSAGDEKKTNTPVMKYPQESPMSDSFYAIADINVLRGDHLRLEYINIDWSENFRIKSKDMQLKMYVNISNLGLLWAANKEHIDPEFPYRMTPPKMFSFGIKLDY
ncbi:SusC/RagA family TonB-linked outer membrane protein [Sphingobacterium kitahiroshimense]|uniref:SusC/RagA family TonB-linked outer membrane protein n=1 Tax=Sphingobacterium kitahiroshimense TaxID=470446 RepID=A0ABV0BP69_9SPHI